jgi:hypothetical protein
MGGILLSRRRVHATFDQRLPVEQQQRSPPITILIEVLSPVEVANGVVAVCATFGALLK